ncbi:multidrug transporter [Anopheles sinensis]|uniref:Multidrug transporter n=1 Tax=Anopheles sinensis TaxID=74873 RepID=A0A084WP67_ANOSI|nr:multidrug transporter [Anopheles sinensis]
MQFLNRRSAIDFTPFSSTAPGGGKAFEKLFDLWFGGHDVHSTDRRLPGVGIGTTSPRRELPEGTRLPCSQKFLSPPSARSEAKPGARKAPTRRWSNGGTVLTEGRWMENLRPD